MSEPGGQSAQAHHSSSQQEVAAQEHTDLLSDAGSDNGAVPQTSPAPPGIRRLNWGCGDYPQGDWINSDIKDTPGVDIARDIRFGLPLETNSIDYAVTIHALPEIQYHELVPALRELRRVLKPGGVLRLALPDLDKGIRAYVENDRDYFLVPDEDTRSIGGKFVTQMLWYGWSRCLFTYDFIEELLIEARFSSVARCFYRQTSSPFPEIVEEDSREHESLFAEAVK